MVNVSPTREVQDIVRSLGLAVEQLKDQILPSKQQQEFLQERQRFIYLNLDQSTEIKRQGATLAGAAPLAYTWEGI